LTILPILANPYIEFKNELPMRDTTLGTETNHLRLGYKLDNNFYIESGPMTGGYGFETGYKVQKGKWIFKGKFEGSNTNNKDYFKSKLQTEIRYTFGD